MRFSAIFLISTLAATAAQIPQGAHLMLRMENSITTRTAKDGDYVYLRTGTPISVAGNIILPVGSYVQGVVTNTRRSGRVKGRAELAIRLDTITLPSGPVYKFSPKLASVDSPSNNDQKVMSGENAVQAGPTHGQDAARIAILAGSGATIGALVAREGSGIGAGAGAGIGAGAGAAVGLATVLLTRGREVELRQGTALDVVFDRPVGLE
jgi:type IV secretion system protein VirB10